MVKVRRGLVASAGVLLVAGAMGVAPAQAAVDAPPALTTPAASSFLVGSRVSVDTPVPCDDAWQPGQGKVWVTVQQVLSWSGSDDTGPVSYSWVENTKGWGPGAEGASSPATRLVRATTDANQECGGGSWMPSDWDITATDASGQAITNNVGGGLFSFTQNNNATDDSHYAAGAVIDYSAGWATATCGCWSDGSVTTTSEKGATATITFAGGRSSDLHVGLVMHRGPARGRFRVLVNGTRVATVNTHAPTNQPRMVVWQRAIKVTDTVTIVNLASRGHGRIDLDGVLTN
ncbi:MAG: hypothetical protein KDB63_03100 [Nocardioidaceae bacterium]|nr:hypothetical protein [Nocardioidaceae bacterium]